MFPFDHSVAAVEGSGGVFRWRTRPEFTLSPLTIEVLFDLKRAENPHSKPLSQTLLKQLKGLFQFRPPHRLKHAEENL